MTPHPSLSVIGPAPKPFNLAAYVLGHADRLATKVALKIVGEDTGSTLTYGDLAKAVVGTAQGLQNHGLTQGDRVLMRLGNTVDFPIVFLGAIYAGLVPIPTSAQLTTAEVNAIVAETNPKLIAAGASISLPDQDIPILTKPDLDAIRTLKGGPADQGDPDRPAYIIYTSGTSGRPRPVVHAHRAIWARRMMLTDWYALEPDDVMLHAGAFNWTYTLGTGLLDPWAIGATSLIPAEGTPITQLPKLLAQHDATLFAAAPGVFRRILRAPMRPLPRLRHGLSAGEKLPASIARRWEEATGTPIFEAYGMSECSTFISTAPGKSSDALGWPQRGRRVSLRDEHGQAVTPGNTGMIAINKDDPGLMLGYLDAPAETAARYKGGWFMTGDLGCEMPDGSIRYDGRADDMMNAGGYRVSPIEVETVLAAYPGIHDVAAVELRLKPDTSIIAAFYTSSEDIVHDHATAFAAQALAGYKLPRMLIRLPALPRGTNNKLLRRQLRQDWEAKHGQT